MVEQLPDEWTAPERWRFRCPRGHAHIHPSDDRESAYCTPCNESYRAGLIRNLREDSRREERYREATV